MTTDHIPEWVKETANERDAFPALLLSDPVELSITPKGGGAAIVRSVARDAYGLDPDRYWRDVLEEHAQGLNVH